MEEYPDRGVSWFAVGCYYLCTRQFETARRYFGKATSMENAFAPAWIGFGHSFALQDESDQVCSESTDLPSSGAYPGLRIDPLGETAKAALRQSLRLKF